MNNIKSLASKIGIGVVFLAVLFFGLKGCVVTLWKSPEMPSAYGIHGGDGRSLVMVFMPRNETYIVYSSQKPEFLEAALTKMRGTYGTHYFWRLWGLDGPGTGGGLFGLRVYPEGVKPVVMETTILQKTIHGEGDPTLGGKGDRTHPVLLFTDDAVRFEGMWLEKESTSMEMLSFLEQRLKSPSQ